MENIILMKCTFDLACEVPPPLRCILFQYRKELDFLSMYFSFDRDVIKVAKQKLFWETEERIWYFSLIFPILKFRMCKLSVITS